MNMHYLRDMFSDFTFPCIYCESEETKYEDFRDDEYRREFLANGICQKCQDEWTGDEQ